MANFEYIARTFGGEQVTGVMQAENEAAVVRTLDDRQLYPVRIAEQSLAPRSFRRRVKLAHLCTAYEQLSDLLSAGVPMMRALDTLVRVGGNPMLTDMLRQVRDDVSAGEQLADAMTKFPTVFTPLHTAIIRAGERAGFLEEALTNLAGFVERQDELRSKVRGALVYPAVLVTVGTLIVTGILVGLVPRFKTFFENISLPLPTRLLFGLSDLLVNQLWLVILLAILAVVLLRAGLRSEAGKRLWDRMRLKLPVIGMASRMVAITRFCRILGTMLHNGVPILQSLDIGKDATGSVQMAASIAKAADNVRGGDPLAEPLRASGFFPEEVVEMIAVGEESNQLEKVLLEVADKVERRTNRRVDAAVKLMEPVILVMLAAVIGFVMVGLLYPMFAMGELMGQ